MEIIIAIFLDYCMISYYSHIIMCLVKKSIEILKYLFLFKCKFSFYRTWLSIRFLFILINNDVVTVVAVVYKIII